MASDDLHRFGERLKNLYSSWEGRRLNLWGSSDILTFATSRRSNEQKIKRSTDKKAQRRNTHRLKASVLSKWLFGRDVYETIFVFTNEQIHCLCSSQEVPFLKVVQPLAKEAVGVDVLLYVKPDSDDGSALMDDIVNTFDDAGVVIGYIEFEILKGDLARLWFKKLSCAKKKQDKRIQLVDITKGLSKLFSVKDIEEIEKVKKAAYFSTDVMKKFIMPELDKIMKREGKVSHSSLSKETLKAILQPSKTHLNHADEFAIAFDPVFQSGGCFDLKPGVPCDNKLLKYSSHDVIISSVGTRFENYCSFIARTFLIDPIELQRKAYEVLYKAHEAAISELKPGNKVSAAYEAAVSVVKKEGPELSRKLTKHAGSGIGLELSESGLNLNEKNGELVKEGMVFNVSLGFQNLKSNLKGKEFSLWLADTVIVNSVNPEVLTAGCSKTIENIKLPLAGGERQPEFVILEDDDDDEEICKKRKRREMEDLEEAYSILTQLDANINDTEALNIKLEVINAAREKNKSEDQEDLAALHVHEKKINDRLKKMELARKAQSEFDECNVLFDEFDHL